MLHEFFDHTTMDNLTFASIPGADHAYTHQRDYVWGVVRQWLEKI